MGILTAPSLACTSNQSPVKSSSTSSCRCDLNRLASGRSSRTSDQILRQRREEIEMLPPTFVTLTELAACSSVAEALERAAGRPVPVFEPHFVIREGLPTVSIYEGDSGYASSDPDIHERHHRMVLARGNWQYLNDGVISW